MIKDLKPGVEVKLTKLTKDSHETKPPSRASETKLISILEEKNIGRPSTYASIVSLIQDRGYVAKKGSQLYPTPLGFAVARLLNAKFPHFVAYEYTAEMEERLDEISEGKQDRANFLKSFWYGKAGYEKEIEKVLANIDFKEIEQFATIDLHNGYSIKYSKFGTFLQDENAEVDANGYKKATRLSDDIDVWDYKETSVCEETFEKNANKKGPRELGVLDSGMYSGWTVYVREGKFGAYVSALHPDHVKAVEAGKKPGAKVPAAINHALTETEDLDTIELKDVVERYAEVKLPRWSDDGLWLVGIGKKGPYIGHRKTKKARPVFKGFDGDPKAATFDEVKQVWDDKEQAKDEAAAKKASKTPAKKPAAKKPAVKKAPAKKPTPKK